MLMRLFQIGNNDYLMLGALAVCQAFYFSILEEYYTGGLFLGIFNGVTDGSVVVIGVYIFGGIFGTGIF